MDLRWPERTGEGFGQTALSRLGRSKCRRLGAASARSGRADEDNVPGGAPLHRRDDAARGGEEDAKVSVGSAQRFLSVHAAAYNIFNVQCHLTSTRTHPAFRASAMNMWHAAVAVS